MRSGRSENDRQRPRKRRPPIVPIIGLVVGLGLLVAPIAFDLLETWQNRQAISTMTDSVNAGDDARLQAVLAQARAYNEKLAGKLQGEDAQAVLPYDEQLAWNEDGAISWLEIPRLNLKLPVYRGTSAETLSSGIGHLEGTSLPVGGESSHCVLTGHSGMYNSRMLDDLRQMEKGDLFAVHTLGEELVYEVEDISVVLPEEVGPLSIVPGRNLCTLVTCTPCGVNDHRLLVTGHRTDKQLERPSAAQEVVAYATNMRVLPFIAGLGVAILGVLVYVLARRRKRKT